MIITNEFIFIHLQKCAGTTIREFLMKTFPNHIRTRGEHVGVSKIPKEHRHKLIFGTIRHPLEWYVSFYADQKEGTLFNDLTHCEFEEFLRRCFFKEIRILHNLNFPKIRKEGIGIYTECYNYCYGGADFKPDIHFIKVENLREGLIHLLKLNEHQIKIFDAMERWRTSEHRYYLEYYNQEMIDWIKAGDKKIIEKHNYLVRLAT